MDVLLASCFECDRNLEHCHGTAIVHWDGSPECTDNPECAVGGELHVFVTECEDDTCCGVPDGARCGSTVAP